MGNIIDRYTVEFAWFGLGILSIGFLDRLLLGQVDLALLAGIVICLLFWRVRTRVLFEGSTLLNRELIWLFIGILCMSLIKDLRNGQYFWAGVDALFIWLNWQNWRACWR